MLIGAGNVSFSTPYDVGKVYVVFGKLPNYSDLILSSFTAGTSGFYVSGPLTTSSPWLGKKCSRGWLGDVNGDDIDDFAVSAYLYSALGRANAGAVWVIYGKASTDTVVNYNLTNSLGSGGIQVYILFLLW